MFKSRMIGALLALAIAAILLLLYSWNQGSGEPYLEEPPQDEELASPPASRKPDEARVPVGGPTCVVQVVESEDPGNGV